MSSSLPEGAAHAPLKIEARGSKPALRGVSCLLFHFLDALVVGSLTTRRRCTVGGAQRRSRRLILTVLHFVFVFSLGGPTPSEAAGGRPLTQKSKKLGLGRFSVSHGMHGSTPHSPSWFNHMRVRRNAYPTAPGPVENSHTSEGGRDDRGVPYHAESTLSSAQCST